MKRKKSKGTKSKKAVFSAAWVVDPKKFEPNPTVVTP